MKTIPEELKLKTKKELSGIIVLFSNYLVQSTAKIQSEYENSLQQLGESVLFEDSEDITDKIKEKANAFFDCKEEFNILRKNLDNLIYKKGVN